MFVQKRVILLGLCLPMSCSNQDTSFILTSRLDTMAANGKGNMTVLNVRSVPGSYSLMRDTKFHALG